MTDLIIELNGEKGLADGFHGDQDMVTPQPELRLSKATTDIVSGQFNPDLRKGYLAPVTTASTALTLSDSVTTVLGSVEYDYVSGEVYWADRIDQIFGGSSLTDTSLTLLDTLEDANHSNQKYDEIHDLQIYQIDGDRKLFFVGKGLPIGHGPEQTIAIADAEAEYVSGTIAVKPFASTKPTVIDDTRFYSGVSGNTRTHPFTVSSGTNTVLVAFMAWDNNAPEAWLKWNGTEMDRVFLANVGPSIAIYTMENPEVGSYNLEGVTGSNSNECLIYAYVLENAAQTNLSESDGKRETSATATEDITVTPDFIDENQHLMVMAFSAAEMEPDLDLLGTSYYDTTNTYGSDMMFELETVAYGLQAGYGDLPFTGAGLQDSSWLASSAIGGFLQTLESDYAFMRTADNGFAYIFADNHIHKVDGTITGGVDGTVTKDVVLFPDYFRITDAIDYRSRLYTVVHQYPVDVATTTLDTYTGNCGVYVWNRVSTQFSGADYVQLPGVREIKRIYATPDGELKLLVIADNGLVQVRQFGYNESGGVVFGVEKTLGIGAFPQFADGLTSAGDKTIWIANDGKLYSQKGTAVTQLFQVKAPGVTSATLATNIGTGALFYGSGDETASNGYRSNKQALTFSYLDSATQYLKKIYPFDLTNGSNTAQAQAQGDVYTGVNLIPMTSDMKNIRVYNFPTTGTGTDIIATLKIYFNQSTTASKPDGMTKSITKDEAKRGYVDFKINQQYINAVQIEVEWSTSENLGVDTYLPSVAVVSHEASETQSPDNG